MTAPRVVVAEALPAAGLEPLREAGCDVVDAAGAGADLAALLADADALVVRSGTQVTRELLAAAPRLRVVGRAGVGVDNIDVAAATERGVAVFNSPTGNTISAAELAFALLLSLVRKVPAADRSMREGRWDRKGLSGVELNGRTLGLLGAGRIGTAVARRARAFGMSVVAFDPYLSKERAAALEIELATLDELLARADVVTLHVPLTDETRGLLDEKRLRSMKPGALLVNAARGGIVDEAALARVLADGHLGGAALDVFADEPPAADSPLRSAPNVVLTPHLGASTAEAQHNVAYEVAASIRDALIHDDLGGAINAPSVGGAAMRRLRPALELARRLGVLAQRMAPDAVSAIELRYAGAEDEALTALTASALIGLLSGVVGRGAVNLVNARFLAESRGIEVRATRDAATDGRSESIEVVVRADGYRMRVGGVLLDADHARLVRVDDYHVDVRPEGTLLILRNRDVPGVIGRVGSLLGDAGINIGEYHQSRREAGGEALATITVDGAPAEDVVARLRALPDVLDARVIVL